MRHPNSAKTGRVWLGIVKLRPFERLSPTMSCEARRPTDLIPVDRRCGSNRVVLGNPRYGVASQNGLLWQIVAAWEQSCQPPVLPAERTRLAHHIDPGVFPP